MKYRIVSFNCSLNRKLIAYKIQKQYSPRKPWYDVKFNGKTIPFKKETAKSIINSLNKKI